MLSVHFVVSVSAAWCLPSYVLLDPEEFTEIRTESLARSWKWSCSDDSVVDWDPDRWTCGLRGLRPGTATITVRYTMDNGLSPSYEVTETCTVIVKDPTVSDEETPSKLRPLISYGKVGDDVSGIIDGAKGFNYGFLPVRYNGLWGLANADMKLIVPFQYEDNVIEEQETYSNSYCAVDDLGRMAVRVDGRDYIIDWRGNVIYAASGAGKIIHAYLHEGYFLVRRYYDLNHLDKYEGEYYDFSGKEITQAQAVALQGEVEAELARLDEAHGDLYSSSGYTYRLPTSDEVVLRLNNPGYADKVDNRYGARDVREGLLVLPLKGGMYGAIDVTGLIGTEGEIDEETMFEHTVIPFEYDYLHDSSEGWISYQKGSEFGIMENPIAPPDKSQIVPVPDPAEIKRVAVSGGTVEARIDCSERSFTAYCAFYQADGTMLGVEKAELSEGEDTGVAFAVSGGASTAKIFVLDERLEPQCAAKEVRL